MNGLWTFSQERGEEAELDMGLGGSEDQRPLKWTCAILSTEDSDFYPRTVLSDSSHGIPMRAALGDSMAYAIDERVGWLTMDSQSSFLGVFVFLSLGPEKAYVNPFAGAETLRGKT